MKFIKNWLNRLFIEGLSGMALGLFSTLIIGTIIVQLGTLIQSYIDLQTGNTIIVLGKLATALTGAGIGAGVAYKFKESPLVVVSAMVCGLVGAFATKIISGSVFQGGVVSLAGPGEPLGAFLGAYVGIEIGHLVSNKTKIDIILTPLVTIFSGSIAGLLLGPPISGVMNRLGDLINWGTEQQPFLMGIIVSVLMGIILTLPISSAALGVILNLNGLAAGAAAVGCAANMIGFAFASYKENKIGGVFAQGLGTSMLQIPNIVKKPIIWLPAILTSAILGPVSTCLLKMTNNATGSGMGTCGFVGPIMAYQTMIEQGVEPWLVLVQIVVMHFILPAFLAFGIGKAMRKLGLIKDGDMKLDI
ncbi:MAG: PTS sugar transporter subunit IIC [Clostridia bacterium]|nr:PTS sugar transporter subunit IIC [Clostridia bacterium]